MLKRPGNIKPVNHVINSKFKIYETLYRGNLFNVSSQLFCVLSYESHTFLLIFLLSFNVHVKYHLPLEVVNKFSDFLLNSHCFFYTYLYSHPPVRSITCRGRTSIRRKQLQGTAMSKDR